MPSDDLTSPEDPDWVDAIVRRAMERAAADPVATSLPITAPVTSAPASAATDLPVAPAHVEAVTSPPTFEPEPVVVRRQDVASSVSLTGDDPAPTARFGNPEAPRLPRAEDFVSSHDPTDPSSRAMIAGATTATEDRFHDDRFDDDLDLDDLDPATSVSSRMRSFLEWGAVIIGALAVALLIKTFLVQAYVIPSESMVPTLEIGDRVLVNKLSYAVGEIDRGDLIVFQRPPTQAEGEDDLIKRVVALGGETIEIRDGEVFIRQPGGTETFRLEEPYLEDGVVTDGLQNPPGCVEETTDGTTCTVPEGHLFMMGDNRGGSSDSRFFGPISEDLVVGRAFLRVWPLGRLGFL